MSSMQTKKNDENGGPRNSDAVVVRHFAAKDRDTVRQLVATGLTGQLPMITYVFLRTNMWLLLAVFAAAVSMGAVIAPNVVALVAVAVVAALLPSAALSLYAWSEMRTYISKSLKDDLDQIGANYSASGFGPGSAFWVAESVDGKVLGCVGLQRHSSDRAELRRMSVSKDARRQGIAKTLARHLAAHAAQQGFKEVFLTTSSGQPSAMALYLREGYKRTKAEHMGVVQLVTFVLQL